MKTLLLAITATSFTQQALAHAGHGDTTLLASMLHWFMDPAHLGSLSVAAIAAWGASRAIRRLLAHRQQVRCRHQ